MATDLKDAERTAKALAQKHSKPPMFEGLLLYLPRALSEVAKVSAYGKDKHGFEYRDRGFLRPEYTEDMYQNAALRHLRDRITEGPINHEDGGVRHLAQAAWDTLAALEKELMRERGISYEEAVGEVVKIV